MAANPSVKKRQKEAERRDHQQAKADRRRARKQEKESRAPTDGEDPDLAGIVPGPQRPAEDI
ncbi:MAG: hypothetical protein U0263_06550 [Polyangiaceae bacterium]